MADEYVTRVDARPVFKDAYTRAEFIKMLTDRHGYDKLVAIEIFDNLIEDEKVEIWTAKDIWALPASAVFEGELYVPYDEVQYQVIPPKRTWNITALRAWFARGFDRVYTLTEVPSIAGTRRRMIKPVSRIGALMALSEVRPDMRWISERTYRFMEDRFYTGFGIDQFLPMRYEVYIPPEVIEVPVVKKYAGSIRWCCHKSHDTYDFFREITIFADVSLDIKDIDDYFMDLLECVLEELNYPSGPSPEHSRVLNILENWGDMCLSGKYSNMFEVSEVEMGSPKGEHPNGYWEYVEYDAETQEQLKLITNGTIDVDDCVGGK